MYLPTSFPNCASNHYCLYWDPLQWQFTHAYMLITIYIGHKYKLIYIGDITIPGGMTYTVDSYLNGLSPQFTLTCISTGGPATTVSWTRDSTNVTGGALTVLDNAETAQYTHNLTVRLGGLYQCIVENTKPSTVSASLFIQGRADRR